MSQKNGVNMEEIQQRLAEPFPEDVVKWRVLRTYQLNNKLFAWVAAYLESRDVMDRLDSVVGIDNWESEFKEIHDGVACGIRIWFDENKSRVKWDGADVSRVEATKGAVSNSLKRAAVQWGIGRYLYDLGQTRVEIFPDTNKGKNYYSDSKLNIRGSWSDPKLPNWALPQGTNNQTNSNATHQQNQTQNERDKAMNFIYQFEQFIGLNEAKYIIGIFNMANTMNINQVEYIRQQATDNELKNYYQALKPVRDFLMIGKEYNTSIEDMLYYAQLVKPQIKVESVLNLFFQLNAGDLSRINEMAKQEYQKNIA